ncbi:glycoside hydrolase family 3 N-terminal domain-containing protein [Spirochaetia bacterium 38H-sp]|uniref:Glycoside hydrolase family 3 N-terminal domain-containing protein n=1 Tax=Rarispira pelagica TaxID=3141764 RepID=A0ABU9UCT4_9SPIR
MAKEHVKRLLSELTVEEKASLMLHVTKPVDRLGLPAYNWWNEALHGVANSGEATVFPQAIGLAASFDDDLVGRVAEAISLEARAKFNEVGARDACRYGRGLTFWSPNINIYRDPRWGRGQETYGEDPFLTARLGKAFVKGLQGEDRNNLRVAACAKHYAVHSGPEGLRHTFDARVSEKDLRETYLPAFKALVEAGVEAVMGAYNRVNGEPACGSKRLLEDILRGEWGFDGHVVSDCWAIADFHQNHKVTSGPEESIAMALKSGCDLNCGNTYEHLLDALKKGLITEDDINRAVERLLTTLDRLGLLEEGSNPYSKIRLSDIDWQAHRALSLEAAEKSIVLLKNNGILPLDKSKLAAIYVTGPNAANVQALLGNYSGVSSRLVTILEGITGEAGPAISISYKVGVPLHGKKINPNDWATGVARYTDVTIAVLGRDTTVEGEEGDAIFSDNYADLKELEITEEQLEYLRKLKSMGKPVIAVILAGSPVSSPELYELADAVLYGWYPGQEGGNAIANILFGKKSPSGKLPITFPSSTAALPDFTDYSMRGRTYRYMEDGILFPFGFGLTYADIKPEEVKVQDAWNPDEALSLEAVLTNTSAIDAEEVVQVYASWKKDGLELPRWQLVGFKRTEVKANSKTTVKMDIAPDSLRWIDNTGHAIKPEGSIKLHIGLSSPLPEAWEKGAPRGIEKEIKIK